MLLTVMFEEVRVELSRMPLLPQPTKLFWRMSLIRLPVIVPPLTLTPMWMPLIVAVEVGEELMPEMTLRLMMTLAALPT